MTPPPAIPDHVWRWVISTGSSHLFHADDLGDDEGVMKALCTRLFMAFRVSVADRVPCCMDCTLLVVGSGIAETLEEKSARLAAMQQTALRDEQAAEGR